MTAVTGKTKVLAIFGNPVTHSLSPQMHAGWIADHGIDATYVALPLAHEGVGDALRGLKNVGFWGANVTVPFKEAAAAAADVRDPLVVKLGVANTLAWRNGKLHAFNTDAPGARRALDEGAPDWRGTVLMIGAGGAARAMLHGIADTPGTKVIVANRTRATAEKLVSAHGAGEVCDWSELPSAMARADVIVNATSLGMTGKDTIAWPLEHAKDTATVFDAVYAPLETELLKTARARGMRAVDGLGMLIHQGALAFEIWFGVKPDTMKARERLLAILAARI